MKAIDVLATYRIFVIPCSCFSEYNTGQVLIDDLADAKFLIWLNMISASDFNFVMSHPFPRNSNLNFSFIFLMWVKMLSKSAK